jgi:hypothetical protein
MLKIVLYLLSTIKQIKAASEQNVLYKYIHKIQNNGYLINGYR